MIVLLLILSTKLLLRVPVNKKKISSCLAENLSNLLLNVLTLFALITDQC